MRGLKVPRNSARSLLLYKPDAGLNQAKKAIANRDVEAIFAVMTSKFAMLADDSYSGRRSEVESGVRFTRAGAVTKQHAAITECDTAVDQDVKPTQTVVADEQYAI